MTDQITVVGNIANDPVSGALPNGTPTLRFRLATNRRRFDRDKGAWVDETPNWYSVTAFRTLAANGQASLTKGQRVVVSGRLRVRAWESEKGSRGTDVEIMADALGPDLLFGTADFRRTPAPSAPGGDSWSAREPADASPGGHDEGEDEDVWRAPGVPGGEPETPF